MALTGFTDICESFPPFQIKSSRWDESKLKIQRTFLEVFPPDTVLPSVSPPRVILLIFFFLHISLVSFRWSEHFQQSFPKKNKTNIYSFYIKSAQKTKKQIKHLHCQQEFEHNAVILTLHRDVNQFREFRWRSRLVNRLTVTNTKTGGCSDYQLHCKKQSHHSSLEFWGGMVSPGKHAYTEWEPPPPPPPPITHYCCFAQCAKTKRGANHDGRTEEELQQKHRTQSDASGGFQKSTFVHFHLCRWRAERDNTIVWARGPIRWLLFL